MENLAIQELKIYIKIATTNGIINLINNTPPNITEKELISYENDKKRFLGN